MIVAYECYADEDVFRFLRDQRRLAITGFHAFGQGEVVNAVQKRRADIGIVDEDPLASHHGQRDRGAIVKETENPIVRRHGEGHLIVVKPELEPCFLRSTRLVRFDSSLPDRADLLRAALGVPNAAKHRLFRSELAAVYEASVGRGVRTLPVDLEEAVRSLLG